MVLSILLTFTLEETPEFLHSRGKEAAAVRVLENIAKRNKKTLPNNFKLTEIQHHCLEITHTKSKSDDSYGQVFLSVLTNWSFLKNYLLLILIGTAGKMINDGFNYILTDVLFIEGQTNDYCHGTDLKSYYLSKSDYLKLFLAQQFGLITAFITFPVLKFKVSFKIQSLICFSVSSVLVSSLYFCPHINVAIAILLGLRVSMQLVRISSLVALVQLDVPVKVRGIIFSLALSLRNLSLPFFAYFEQVLSKKSQHYVTTITLAFILLSLIAALLIPRNINSDKRTSTES